MFMHNNLFHAWPERAAVGHRLPLVQRTRPMTAGQNVQQVGQLRRDIGRIVHGVGQRLAQALPEPAPQAMDGHANRPLGLLQHPCRVGVGRPVVSRQEREEGLEQARVVGAPSLADVWCLSDL